jgi:uncharacterized protein
LSVTWLPSVLKNDSRFRHFPYLEFDSYRPAGDPSPPFPGCHCAPVGGQEVRALKTLGNEIGSYESAEWIRVSDPRDRERVKDLMLKLDEGEAEAISLALELNCDLLLMDERIGTKVARDEGLATVGLVGVLIKAKREKVINEVGPLLHELRIRAGFWIGNDLERRVLRELGES